MWTTLFTVVLVAAADFAIGAMMFERYSENRPRRRRPPTWLRLIRSF